VVQVVVVAQVLPVVQGRQIKVLQAVQERATLAAVAVVLVSWATRTRLVTVATEFQLRLQVQALLTAAAAVVVGQGARLVLVEQAAVEMGQTIQHQLLRALPIVAVVAAVVARALVQVETAVRAL
jgi:hypothetical protein